MAHKLAHDGRDDEIPSLQGNRESTEVGRREYTHIGAAAILTLISAGQVEATNGAGDEEGPERERSLQIHGSGTASTYEFTVGGRLKPAPESSTDAAAGISGRNAEGAVTDGNRRYRFTGELHALAVDGDASVSLNGRYLVP